MIRVLHLITDLEVGGAESMLERLVTRMRADRFHNLVVSLTDLGPIGGRLLDAGVPTQCLRLRRGSANPGGIMRLAAVIRQFKPDLLQTWLYHADLLGTLARYFVSIPRLSWNIRCAEVDFSQYARTTRWTVAALARLSALPDVVVANSEAGRASHLRLGYRPKRWEIVANGFDLQRFRPDARARAAARAELGIDSEAFLVALPARADPMKDHETFLRAARRVLDAGHPAKFALVGRGADRDNPLIGKVVAELGLQAAVLALGERADMPRIFAAADLVALSSAFGEGFPNVLGEAMACGVACVSTDVGDAAAIIDKTGFVVPPRDPAALAAAMSAVAAMSPEEVARLRESARRRIEQNFSIEAVVRRYEALYEQLIQVSPDKSERRHT
jgi:glycosyltransferase involved in cell wall biosynthesis